MNWRLILIFIFLYGIHWYARAQYPSRDGKFMVDQVKGCAPLTITVTPDAAFICDSGNPCAAFYEDDVNSEPLITPPFTHTYTQPGIYNLKILRSALYDSIQIEVLPNIQPQFDVYSCGNNGVSVQLKDSNYDEYIINYNDGNPEVTVGATGAANHTYAAGTQTVTVRGHDTGAADNCSSAGMIVTPLLALPAPTITLLQVLDAGSVRLEFNALPNIQYKLAIATNNATTFQQVATLYNTTVDTVFNLRTDDNFYCFQLAAFDPCNNSVFTSATICSANLDLSIRNNAMDLVWTTSQPGISGFQLNRDANDGTFLVAAPAGSPYSDAGINCGTEYCYQLVTNYPNGSQSISLTKCGVGLSNDIPSRIDNVTSVVTTSGLLMDWQTDPNFSPAEFTIDKSTGGGNYIFLATSAQNAFTDAQYDTEDAPCYHIRYKDVCGNQSPSGTDVCPILLTGDLLNDNSISLTWTPYSGWALGVSSYTVEKYTEDGILLQSFQVGTATSFVDTSDDLNHQAFLYIVKANAVESGLGQSGSNRISVLKDPNLFHPTAFTPNGDNLNDHFTVFGQYVVGFEMKIFNRWGELLFTTTDIQAGWDGKFRGAEMPEGTYAFIAHITDRAGRTFKRSGSVLLLRRGN